MLYLTTTNSELKKPRWELWFQSTGGIYSNSRVYFFILPDQNVLLGKATYGRIYLGAFPKITNKIFKESQKYLMGMM